MQETDWTWLIVFTFHPSQNARINLQKFGVSMIFLKEINTFIQ